MKVKKIIPCVCIDHIPESGDSCEYGMPNLTVCSGIYKGKVVEHWSAFCPNCGRGNHYMMHDSAYKALREWNETQWHCWLWASEPERYHTESVEWKKLYFKELFPNGNEWKSPRK